MRQVLQSLRTGALEVAEVPPPSLAPGAVLVRTEASLLSAGTERASRAQARASLLGKARRRPDLVRQVLARLRRDGLSATAAAVLRRLDQPGLLGYACAGRVVAIGEGVEGLAVGQRVACAGAGVANHAELNLVPRLLCAAVPDGVPAEEAAFATLGAIALHGLRLAAPAVGETFAVVGLGLVGQLAVQLLRASGCRVLAVDLDPARVALAASLGAEAARQRDDDVLGAARALTGGRGVDGVLLCAATPGSDPLELAAALCRDRARVVAVGDSGLEVPRRAFFEKELSLQVSRSTGPGRYDPDYEERGHDYPAGQVRWTEQRNLEAFLGLQAAGTVRVAPLVSHRLPVERAAEAFALLEGPGALGVVLRYDADRPLPATLAVAPARPRQGALGVGFLGAGAFAAGTLGPQVARSEGVRLVSVASARGVSARHLAGRLGFERCAGGEGPLLQDPEVEAVFVATRHDQHARLATAALAAGKHVFLEKPVALDEDGLQEVLGAWRASGRVLGVGFNRRFAPLALALRDALSRRAAPLVLHHRVCAEPLPDGAWQRDPAVGGGRLVGECCHFVDLCAFLAGARPVSVFARGVTPAGGARGDENLVLSIGLSDGSVATVTYVASGDPTVPKEQLEVLGDGLHARLDDFRALEVRRDGRTRRWRSARDKGHRGCVAAFLEAARRGGPPPIPLDEVAAVTRCTFAAAASLATGEPVDLRP